MIFSSQKNELKCYGRIFDGDGINFIYLFEKLAKDYSDIIIRLHTYGGSVIDGNLMYNAINKSSSKVTIIVEGLAASMGAILLMATDDVRIVENGYVMVHAPSGWSNGTAKELKSRANLLEAIQVNFIKKLISRTGKPKKEIEELMVGDHWFDAEKAKNFGLVSNIIEAKNMPAIPIQEPKNMGELEVFNAYASLLMNINKLENNTTINMKQLLITAFSLSEVTADSSDTAVLQKLRDKFSEIENNLQTEKDNNKNLENQIKAVNDKDIEAVISSYIENTAPSISEEEKKVLKTIGENNGVEALKIVLKTSSQASSNPPNIYNLIENGKVEGARAAWTWDDWQEKDPRGLENLAKSSTEIYNRLYTNKYKS